MIATRSKDFLALAPKTVSFLFLSAAFLGHSDIDLSSCFAPNEDEGMKKIDAFRHARLDRPLYHRDAFSAFFSLCPYISIYAVYERVPKALKAGVRRKQEGRRRREKPSLSTPWSLRPPRFLNVVSRGSRQRIQLSVKFHHHHRLRPGSLYYDYAFPILTSPRSFVKFTHCSTSEWRKLFSSFFALSIFSAVFYPKVGINGKKSRMRCLREKNGVSHFLFKEGYDDFTHYRLLCVEHKSHVYTCAVMTELIYSSINLFYDAGLLFHSALKMEVSIVELFDGLN